MNTQPHTEIATFGAGCFWGVEATFRQLEGVIDAAAGYMGGSLENPTYEQVCSDQTGHAEVVQIEFDPRVISYEKLLKVFWQCHNPTEHNRQGPDIGSQYRSVIFYHSEEQQSAAQAAKTELDNSQQYPEPIATSVEPATTFYRAEEYHQQYLAKHGRTSCRIKNDE